MLIHQDVYLNASTNVLNSRELNGFLPFLKNTMSKFSEAELVEFTVAPQVTPSEGLPYHEWLVEFTHLPADPTAFNQTLDAEMVKQNTYYNDLITGNILRPLKLTALPKGAFIDYMKSIGKLGGQNKVPRLSNDRKVANALLNL